MDGLRELLLAGPGLVFLGLLAWLLRKIIKAARTEQTLEGDRLEGVLGAELNELRARAAAVQGRRAGSRVEDLPAPAGHDAAPVTEDAARDEGQAGPASAAAIAAAGVAHAVRRPLLGADAIDLRPEHKAALTRLLEDRGSPGLAAVVPLHRAMTVLWARSVGAHMVWCERRAALREGEDAIEVLAVAKVQGTSVVGRWTFG